ncbi:MFS transporter [Paucibacter soli]|uniref:MFS transporter n=1 Tax=Paucibacter soli TaxID=3133433 RepID=UPI0030986BDB
MHTKTLAPAATAHAADPLEPLYRKITRRLIPLLFICYVINFIDRSNIGYAQLQMKDALGFGDAVYGLGAGMFFVGYFLFELPSNLLLKRIGARLTLLRIMLLWGAASAATLLVRTPEQFYLARFLLGVFEAGFFPGVMLYLSTWYPQRRRAAVVALFMVATVVAAFITGPVSGWILHSMNGVQGLQGWQWMFLLEGLPAMLLGLVVYLRLPNRPEDAAWLSEAERAALQADLAADPGDPDAGASLRQVFSDPKIYLLSLISFCGVCGAYVLAFWTPTLVQSLGVSDLRLVGLYSVVPNVLGTIVMIAWGRHSDRSGERRWHYALAATLGAIGLAATTLTAPSLGLSLAALALGGSGIVSAMPIFWAVATAQLSKQAAPAAIAVITSIANLAGVAAPALIGLLKARTGSLDAGLLLCAGLLLLAALLMLAFTRPARRA